MSEFYSKAYDWKSNHASAYRKISINHTIILRMLIRVLDLQSFDETLNLQDCITTSQLRDMIQSNFNYDLSASTFYHNGSALALGLILKPEYFSHSNVVVLFNSRIFPQKSYPKVDQAFHFFPSRFQEYYFDPSLTEEIDPAAEERHSIRGYRRFVSEAFPLSDELRADFTWGHPLRNTFFTIDVDHRWVDDLLQEPIEDGDESNPEYVFNDGIPDGFDLTPADLEAIRRLEELGFNRSTVMAVYIAYNRNEAQAENALIALGE
jgi:hypothetical protein